MKFYTGTNCDDYAIGTDDDDILDGLAGNDTLIGGNGNDTINAGLGIDLVDGGYGNDTLIVDYSSNTYPGNNGFGITTTLSNYGSGFNGTISAANRPFNSDRVDFSGIERFKIIGTNGRDILAGGYQQDTLIGGAGDDIIQDNNGGDIIDGGDGFDVLKNAIFNPYPLGGMYNSSAPTPIGGIFIDDLGTLITASDGSSIKNIEQWHDSQWI
jgi:Ca2+-binding RTX toxin-like protein